jgi:hypothetical protein
MTTSKLKPKTRAYIALSDTELHGRLKSYCALNRLSVGSLVESLIHAYLRGKHDKKHQP